MDEEYVQKLGEAIEYLDKAVGPAIDQAMAERKTIHIDIAGEQEVIAPITSQGDPIGVVILMSKDPNMKMGQLEIKLAETAAGFLAKQIEQ